MGRYANHKIILGVRAAASISAILAFGCACSSDRVSDPTNISEIEPIGSLSLCADSYLIALAAPDRIGALSWQAGSPLSTAGSELARHPKLWDSREVIHRVDFPLVGGPGSAPSDNVLMLDWGEDFETVLSNAIQLSDRFALDATALRQAVADLDDLPQPDKPPHILYLSRSGGSAGAGTFVDAVIRKAGGINISPQPGWHTPPVETILQLEPDLILTSFFGSDYRGISDRAVRHAALNRFISETPRLEIEGKLWPCAGPGLITATQQLNQALLDL